MRRRSEKPWKCWGELGLTDETYPVFCSGFDKNGDGGIRTHVPRQAAKRFRVALVMATSIRLHNDK